MDIRLVSAWRTSSYGNWCQGRLWRTTLGCCGASGLAATPAFMPGCGVYTVVGRTLVRLKLAFMPPFAWCENWRRKPAKKPARKQDYLPHVGTPGLEPQGASHSPLIVSTLAGKTGGRTDSDVQPSRN